MTDRFRPKCFAYQEMAGSHAGTLRIVLGLMIGGMTALGTGGPWANSHATGVVAAEDPAPGKTVDGKAVAAASGSKGADAESKTTPDKPVSTGPRKIELLVKEKTFRKEPGTTDLRVTYDDLDLLKILNMDPVSANADEKMPAWLKELDGKRIRIRGFMYPPNLLEGIARFELARDTQICCFGRNPKPYDLISIRLKKGTTTDYIELRPFDVSGIFHIDVQSIEDDDGDEIVHRVYRIDDAVITKR